MPEQDPTSSYVPDPTLEAKLAEEKRAGTFYRTAELTLEEVLIELEEVDMARADKFATKKPLILVELDKRTGGDIDQVNKKLVLDIFEEMTKR